jgi:hypothetical protein
LDKQKHLERLEEIYLNLSKMSKQNKEAILALIELTEKSVWQCIVNKADGAIEFSKYLEMFKHNIENAEERYKKLNRIRKRADTLFSLSRIFPKKQREKKDPIGALAELKMGLTYTEISTPERS